MLSRRQFFAITIIMLVLLVLFQLTGVMKDYWNEYDKNEYAESVSISRNTEAAYVLNSDTEDLGDNYAILIGDSEDSAVGSMAKLWCLYTKRNFVEFESLTEIDEKLITDSDFLLIDSKYLDFDTDTAKLISYAKDGCSMVFCNLPDVKIIKNNQDLQKLLGIHRIYDENVTVEGIELYEGFLLGGRTIYKEEGNPKESLQDLELDMPWYATYANTEKYMVGMLPEDALGETKKVKNEDLPSIIWRNNIGKTRIFAVNGSYMEDITALGILNAFEYEASDYVIYPVVNAQNLVIADFAALSSEYDDKMVDNYTRKQKAVFRDIIWPSLSSIYIKSGDIPTFYINPALNYKDENGFDSKQLVYYMKLIRETRAEAGITTSRIANVSIMDKLRKDKGFYDTHLESYICTSAFVREKELEKSGNIYTVFEDMRTIATECNYREAPVSYLDNDITLQRATVDGFEHRYSDNLRMKSLQTSLAYSNILVDMNIMLSSDEKRDSWENSSERLASNVITYWQFYDKFDKTVMTESDARVRQFLNTDYSSMLNDNTISLSIDNFEGEAYFILRTHNESVEAVSEGSFTQIEEHAYLICAGAEEIEIVLKNDIELEYYKDR